MAWLWVVFAVAVGCLLAIQPTLNAEVGRHLGGPIVAAAVNFIIGLVVLAALALYIRGGLPSLGELRSAPWWAWFGGLIGATFVSTAAFLAPRIGVSAMFASVIFGQLAASLLLDHFGLFNLPVQEISWQRVVGVAMAGAGVLLVSQN
ncbi:DMT family transporter [Ectothiorhodospiraceae bacterium WFHF3C12]|nr:DMT family transporter [Ectothiorhodospiraceae bacterium WFHF3C12]